MASLPRRRFVLQAAGLLPLPFLARRLHATAVADLDARQLRALAEALLPSELGAAGVERAVSGFERWLAGYREGVELVHGYGTGELRYTGPSPALRWSNQLRALAAAAQQQHNTSFDLLSVAQRQALVQSALESGGASQRPALTAVSRAPHLAIGLLSYFFETPEAADLCYGVKIGANSCRPLAQSPRPPLPLARGS